MECNQTKPVQNQKTMAIADDKNGLKVFGTESTEAPQNGVVQLTQDRHEIVDAIIAQPF